MEFLKDKHYWETFSFNICIPGFHISEHFNCKSYGPVVLNKCSTKAIFTDISLQEGLCAIIICKGGLEKQVAYPGLQAIKGLVGGGVPVPVGYLLTKECCLGSQIWEKRLQVTY